MLLFKKKFIDAIRAGNKTQTIRLWKVCRMRPGQRSYIPGAGYIRVLSVDPVELDELSDDDARPDGFASANDLREELSALYGNPLADGHRAYSICFRVFSDEEQAAAVADRKARKAAGR
jgi:hypothetical protein